MSLFQKSVEKKYLSDLDPSLIDKKYGDFLKHFGNPEIQENIRNSKEEQYQGEFLIDLFVNILGYTKNPTPNFNLTTELKNIANSKKADGAILKGDDATAVIELKGTDTTDLDKIETQAFGYKNHHPKCKYVITSNFEKLRFYIQNAVDHVDFDLFNLTREQFSLLWLCLAKDNLLNDLPLKIKESSVLQEENITKKLYADYSKFREAIYTNLVKNNFESSNGLQPIVDKLTLFKKTQKLLDRFLFIFFAEDRLLLPPNSISEIVKQWADLKEKYDEYFPLYSRFKKYFGYMNTGYNGKKYDIYAYNGGLFKPDEVLDNITIDDDILYEHTLRLSNYDFETDVDVNILGHIFEHSLGEIENVQAEIASVDSMNKGLQPLVESKSSVQSKRKKDGIFYTPKYITKYIVENTVGKLCEEKRAELGIVDEEYAKGRKNRKKEIVRTLDKKLDDYRNWLLTLTILDPACGSGAFLNQALEFLINEHRKVDELRGQLLGGAIIFSDITTDILEKNIYGVDLNEESVEIAKLSLWLRTAQKGRKLNTLSNNIKCGNSLIDDPEIAGEKAFDWHSEFPNIFQKKEKKAWHVTWVTHDTRTSERMIKYKVRERRANGEMHVDRSIYLDEKDAIKVTEILSDIVSEEKYNCLAYNIGEDHVHILLICDDEELTNIVRKLKGKSAQKFKEHLGLAKDETFNLWAQKFDRRLIESEEQLTNTIEYISNNREKHQLPNINEGLQPLVQKMICTREHAFRTENTGGFDVVIGNPPYGASFEEKHKEYISNKYESYQYKFESYLYFYEIGVKVLKTGGFLSFITPELFLRLEKSQNIRQFILKHSCLIELKFCGENVFEDVKVNSLILTLKKAIISSKYFKIIPENESSWNYEFDTWRNNPLLKIEYEISPSIRNIIDKIDLSSLPLGEFGEAIQGLTPYDSYRGHSKELIQNRGFHFFEKVDDSCGKWLDGKHVNRYLLNEGTEWLRYGEWLAAPREKRFFENARLLFREVPGQNKRIQATFTEETYYHGHSITPFILKERQNIEKIHSTLAISNSKLVSWYVRYKSSNFSKNTFPKLNPKDIKEIPVPKNIEQLQNLGRNAATILQKTEDLRKFVSRFISLLISKFNIEQLSNKLESWVDLEFRDFLKELQKAKIKLSLSEEAEWMQYFNKQKEKAQTIKSEIEKTDRKIDQMVYELYGLTEEEIKIVEEL